MVLENFKDCFVFQKLSQIAKEKNVQIYLIGGYVRDQIVLGIPNDDIDICVVGGSCSEFAQAVANTFSGFFTIYESYGTAKVGFIYENKKWELEFVGARREFYQRESRNPIVEDGTLDDDMARRDFTINDMAVSLNCNSYGDFIDPYNGLNDIKQKLIKCVSIPEERFSEDPLRMLRAIRFATRFDFKIEEKTLDAIKSQADRISIIVKERILDELIKMLGYSKPSIGLYYLQETGLMKILLPEVSNLSRREVISGIGHKDILAHTFQVVDNVAQALRDNRKEKIYLMWAALLHDIGKPQSKEFHADSMTWTFKDHEIIGSKMIKKIGVEIGLGMPVIEKIQKLVRYHMHPMALCEDVVTDSAIRRFLFEAAEDIDDIMLLVNADLTTKYEDKKLNIQSKYVALQERMKEIEEKDAFRNFKLAFTGDDIMQEFNLPKGREIGRIKEWYKNLVIDGIIPNEYSAIKTAIIENNILNITNDIK